MVRRYGEAILFNPGSVGAPVILPNQDRNIAWAEYGIVSWQNGSLCTQLRRIPIDINLMVKAVHDSSMPHANWWLRSRYGDAVE